MADPIHCGAADGVCDADEIELSSLLGGRHIDLSAVQRATSMLYGAYSSDRKQLSDRAHVDPGGHS